MSAKTFVVTCPDIERKEGRKKGRREGGEQGRRWGAKREEHK